MGKSILEPQGMLAQPIVVIFDGTKGAKSVLGRLQNDPEIGPLVRTVPTNALWLGGDMTLAVMVSMCYYILWAHPSHVLQATFLSIHAPCCSSLKQCRPRCSLGTQRVPCRGSLRDRGSPWDSSIVTCTLPETRKAGRPYAETAVYFDIPRKAAACAPT